MTSDQACLTPTATSIRRVATFGHALGARLPVGASGVSKQARNPIQLVSRVEMVGVSFQAWLFQSPLFSAVTEFHGAR